MWPSESTMTLQVWLTPGCVGRLDGIKESHTHLDWQLPHTCILVAFIHSSSFDFLWGPFSPVKAAVLPTTFICQRLGYPIGSVMLSKGIFSSRKQCLILSAVPRMIHCWMLSPSWTHESLLWSDDALYQVSTTVGTERLCWCPAQRESPFISSLEWHPAWVLQWDHMGLCRLPPRAVC